MSDDIIKQLETMWLTQEPKLLWGDMQAVTDLAAFEIERLRAEIEKLRAALNSIEEYIAGRVHMHNQIAGFAGSSLSGKKQRVRASEAADILGKIRTAATALKETGE